MQAAAVQTSEPDLFPPEQREGVAFTGHVVHAEVAMRPSGRGGFAPTVVLHLDNVGPGRHHLVAHIPFGRDEHAKAVAEASRLLRGQVATVVAPLPMADMHLMLPTAYLQPSTPH